jgi:hypothetical protein
VIRAAVALLLVTACNRTFTNQFFEVTPARSVPALAGKNRAAMHGTACSRVCATDRKYDEIDYCAIATFPVRRRLRCTVSHTRAGQRVELDHSIVVPATMDTATLPPDGPIPLGICKAAGCESQLDSGSTTDAITNCAMHPYGPDEIEPYLVCSFHLEMKVDSYR